MKIWTYEEIEDRVRRDLDLEDAGNFVQNDEMVSYCNEAIDDAESEILKLNEDYFLTSASLALVSSTSSYSLPTDIYGQKVRSIIYANGAKIYEVRRIRDPHKFLNKALQDYLPNAAQELEYILKSATAGAQDNLVFVPTPQESGSYITIWYIRNAKRVPLVGEDSATRTTQLAVTLDLPEWADYIVQYMKCRCYEKELDPRLNAAMAALAAKKEKLVSVLSDRVPDNDDTVPMDVGHYEEHS